MSGNSAAGVGSGLYFYGGAANRTNWVVQNSTISGNISTGSGGTIGTGITMYGNGNALTVQNSTITANQSSNGRGIFANNTSDTIVLESTIVSGNIAGSPRHRLRRVGVGEEQRHWRSELHRVHAD